MWDEAKEFGSVFREAEGSVKRSLAVVGERAGQGRSAGAKKMECKKLGRAVEGGKGRREG